MKFCMRKCIYLSPISEHNLCIANILWMIIILWQQDSYISLIVSWMSLFLFILICCIKLKRYQNTAVCVQEVLLDPVSKLPKNSGHFSVPFILRIFHFEHSQFFIILLSKNQIEYTFLFKYCVFIGTTSIVKTNGLMRISLPCQELCFCKPIWSRCLIFCVCTFCMDSDFFH